MRRIAIVMTAIAFSFTALSYVYSQSAKSGARAKVGRALVKSLPAGVEGVTLVGNKVQIKSGYKFVKQTNGTVTLARMSGGGLGAEGTFSCSSCGNCSATVIAGGILTCDGSCKDQICTLSVVINKARTALIAY